jgi:hypothetical protein
MKLINSQNRRNTNKQMKLINNKITNKSSIKKCEEFCENDYIKETDRIFENIMKKYKLPVKKRSSKNEKDMKYIKMMQCKKYFCNPTCEGYNFLGNKKKANSYRKKIKDGFTKKYTKKMIDEFKKKGALSGCINLSGNYNVFHK